MSVRYHISKNGETNVCTAKTTESCKAISPNGEKSEHFDTQQEAMVESENLLSKIHGELPTSLKPSKNKIIVAVDLDNTVVDFNDGLRQYMMKKNGLTREEAIKRYPDPSDYDFTKGETPWFKDKKEFLDNFLQAEKEGLYTGLKARTGAIKTIKHFLKDDRIELRVLTARNPIYNDDTMLNLKRKGLNFNIENAEDKEHYDAHIFIDDKDEFAEKIRTGKFITSDNVVKEVIVPRTGYNTHLNPEKNWDDIGNKLNETVTRMLNNKK